MRCQYTQQSGMRRGLSFVETVCAATLLGVLAASIFGALSAIVGSQRRQQHELAASEVANRLILQYLDDKAGLPMQGLPVEYAGMRYRWQLTESPVELVPARPDSASERQSTVNLRIDRFNLVKVTAWLSEESGGATNPEPGTPTATLARIVDPVALRNPDTIERTFSDSSRMQEYLDLMSKYNTGNRPRGGSASRTNAPGSTLSNTPRTGTNSTPNSSGSKGGGGK